jgi:hypothetical protein
MHGGNLKLKLVTKIQGYGESERLTQARHGHGTRGHNDTLILYYFKL